MPGWFTFDTVWTRVAEDLPVGTVCELSPRRDGKMYSTQQVTLTRSGKAVQEVWFD